MKKIFSAIVLLVILFVSKNSSATHIMGSEMEYKRVGNDSFLITIYVHKDCKGIFSSPPILIIDGVGFNYSDTVKSSLIACKDVTNTCDTCTRCGDANSCNGYGYPNGVNTACNFNYGIERLTYEYLFVVPSNLNSSDCKFRISFTNNARNGAITTCCANGNLYIYTEIDRCLSVQNTSPKFNQIMPNILYVGYCYSIDWGATDMVDNDSISYHLSPAYDAYNQPCTYQGNYTYQYPLSYTGIGKFNPATCKGFMLDTITGMMYFKPMQQQVFQAAVKIKEWRLINNTMTQISETIRDMQFIVLVAKYSNKNPAPRGKYNDTICAGMATSIEGNYLEDTNKNDKINVWIQPKLAGSVDWYLQNANKTYWSLAFQSQLSDTLIGQDSFKVNYKDNNCQQGSTLSKMYYINYKSCPTFPIQRNYTQLACGKIQCEAVNNSFNTYIYKWVMPGPTGNSISGAQTTVAAKSAGPYYITLMIKDSNGYVWQGYTDTLNIPNLLYVDIGNDLTTCRNSIVNLKAKVYNDTGTVKYYWNGSSTAGTDSLTFNIKNDTAIYIKITDSTGCDAYDTINIKTFPTLSNMLKSSYSTCFNDSIKLLANNSYYNTVLWGNGSTSNYIYAHTTGTYTVDVSDSNRCPNSFSTNVKIIDYPSGSVWLKDTSQIHGKIRTGTLSNPDLICMGDTSFFEISQPNLYSNSQYNTTWSVSNSSYIYSASFGYQYKGAWGTIPASKTSNLKLYLKPSIKDIDTVYGVHLYLQDITGRCDTILLLYIKVLRPPSVNLGNDTIVCPLTPLTLKTSCSVNKSLLLFEWDSIKTYTNDTLRVIENKDITHFVYITDTFGCTGHDSINIIMDTTTKADLGPDRSFCPGATIILSVGYKKPSIKILWSTNDTTSSITTSKPGTYWVKVSNPVGCNAYDTIKIDTIQKAPTGAKLDKNGGLFNGNYNTGTISNPDNICLGDSTSYQIIPPSGYNNSQYNTKWVVTSSPVIRTSNGFSYPAALYIYNKSVGGQAATISILSNNKYADSLLYITFTIQDLVSKCDTTIIRYIEIVSPPKVSLNRDTAFVCTGQSFTFKAYATNNHAPYTFYWNGSTKTDSFTVSKNTSSNYYIVTLDSASCSTTKYFRYEVIKYPTVNLGKDMSLCQNNILKIGSGHWDSNYDVVWNNGSSSDSIIPATQGDYMLTVSTKIANCSSADTIHIQIYPTLSSSIIADKTFSGIARTGSINDPDEACPNRLCKYQLLSPTGYSNSQYGSAWGLASNPIVKTVKGATPITYIYTSPTTSYNGYVEFTPSSNFTDSLIMVVFPLRNMAGNCDTNIIRYIKIKPSILYLGPDTTICNGQPYILDAGAATDYLWNTGDTTQKISVKTTGIYFVSINTKAACFERDTISIKIYKSSTAVFSYTLQPSINPKAYKFSPSDTTQTNYNWDFGDFSNSKSISPLHVFNQNGVYKTILTINENTPCALLDSQYIIINTSVPNIVASHQFTLYPNPTTGKVYISHSLSHAGVLHISVYDQTGKLLMQPQKYQTNSGTSETELVFPESYSEGLYLVRVSYNNEIYNLRLVKMK